MLSLTYADNAVTHMLTGKAVERAVRGHSLVDAALNSMLVAKTYGVSLPLIQRNCVEFDDSLQDEESMEESMDVESELEEVGRLYDNIEADSSKFDDICKADALKTVCNKVQDQKSTS